MGAASVSGVFHLSGANAGEHYVLHADRVSGVRRLDHEPIGGVGASYELLVIGVADGLPVDEDSARRVEDHLVALADEGPPEDETH